jgi:hypothetical protein
MVFAFLHRPAGSEEPMSFALSPASRNSTADAIVVDEIRFRSPRIGPSFGQGSKRDIGMLQQCS